VTKKKNLCPCYPDLGKAIVHPWIKLRQTCTYKRGCIQKFPDWVDNGIYAYFLYYSLRSITKDYGAKIDQTDL
jgi:hypothetical protein